MKKINFKNFAMFSDIAHEKKRELDIRKDVADMIYSSGSGIAMLDLAMRIFKSDGEMELSEDDLQVLNAFFEKGTTPAFIDSFKENLYD